MPKRTVVVTTLAVLFAAFLILVIAQQGYDPNAIDVHWSGTPLPPCFEDASACYGHVLGTDNLGRDLLSRIGGGGEVSIFLSLIALAFELVIGITLGLVSRRGGYHLRYVIMRVGDAISCFPAWPTLIAIVILGTPPERATMPAVALSLLVGAFYSPQITSRIACGGNLHGVVRSLSDQSWRDLAGIIVLLAMIDFLGYGIQPPYASWGNMLSQAQEDIALGWWAAVFPAAGIFVALLAIEVIRRSWFATSRSGQVDPSLNELGA